MSEHSDRASRGFRLVDLIVVVGVLGIAVGVLLVVLMRARQAAAVSQCQNNLKQIVLAIHKYTDTHENALPALSGVPVIRDTAYPQSIFMTLTPYCKAETILPDGMKEPRGRTWQGTSRYGGGPIFSTAFVKAFVCPADSSNSLTAPPTAHGWVGSSYAANAQVFGTNNRVIVDVKSGVAAWNELTSRYNIGNIPDGTTNTIFVAERLALAGAPGADTPCSWVDPPGGGPALGNTTLDPMGCPLLTFVGRSGSLQASLCGPGIIYGGGTRTDPVGALGGLWQYPPPEIGVATAEAATDARAQSQHAEVVHVGLGDGSIRGIGSKVHLQTWLKAIDPEDDPPRGFEEFGP
jgi:type II secretory pathway pseudopilin PulG